MAASAVYLPPGGDADCRCDDVETPPGACVPVCPVRPNFFCGQLLSDQDLSDLTRWTRNRLRLSRERHGHGVVRGLDLHLDVDRPGRIVLEPGYALDACGNDIVVCEAVSLDLSGACKLSESRCEEIASPAPVESVQFMGREVAKNEIIVLDVLLRYKENPTDPLPALGRGACMERSACEFSRVEESFEVSWRGADPQRERASEALQGWEADYFARSRKVVDEFVERFGKAPGPHDVEDIVRWLKEWISRKAYHFGWLAEWLESLAHSQRVLQVAPILFYLVLDARLSYLARCAPRERGSDIVLGRVWLRRVENGARACRVMFIDTSIQHRIPLHDDTWPALPSQVNLAQFFFQPADWVCARLTDAGIAHELEWAQSFRNIDELLAWLDEQVLFHEQGCSRADERLALLALPPPELGARIVGFKRVGSGPSIPERPEKPITERPVPEKPIPEKPIPEKPIPEGPIPEGPIPERPLPERPVPEGPIPERPTPGKPILEKPIPDKPARPESGPADSLVMINGIGDERERRLRDVGIHTFRDLAEADPNQVKKLFPPPVRIEDVRAWQAEARRLTEKG